MIPPIAREMPKKCVVSVVSVVIRLVGDGVSNAGAEEGRGRRPIGDPRSPVPEGMEDAEPPIELSNIDVFTRFRNYCGLAKIARNSLPWEKATRRSMALPSSTGNPRSVHTNCETVALRLATCMDTIRNGLVYESRLYLVT